MRVTTTEMLAVVLFLLAWTLIEATKGTGRGSRSAPGTTYHAAARAGATVTPSDQPSTLENQAVKPAPAPRG